MISPEMINAYRQHYQDHGYVVVPSLIPPDLLTPLRDAADRATDKARRREWKDVRMVGKQFPPWTVGDDVWGVQNLMHPAMGEKVFAEFYGSEDLLAVSQGLMGCEREAMQFDYALSWHRDDVKASATEEEEANALEVRFDAIQWNCALYDDECLSAVPGSHTVIRTPEQRKANMDGGDMPVHVGKYNLAKKRRTLHGCYGSPPRGDTTRARVVLQHDIGYTSDPSFRDTLPESLRPMLDRLNDFREQLAGAVVGYSQDD
ncbi:hypothetical protein IAR55_004219 [Kwoniella newhampshirensis]|uniref:Phytanoyl-CoA dioxygenase n=1 Tax=Kwoniella newhampshirensis TaxID=1651941 RepID=A0AAW0YLU5_9TREE